MIPTPAEKNLFIARMRGWNELWCALYPGAVNSIRSNDRVLSDEDRKVVADFVSRITDAIEEWARIRGEKLEIHHR